MTALLLATHYVHDHDWLPFFPLFPLLFFGLWIAFFLTIGRRWRYGRYGYGPGPESGPGHGWSAEAVLAERYARGEIDETEYQERRTVLRRND